MIPLRFKFSFKHKLEKMTEKHRSLSVGVYRQYCMIVLLWHCGTIQSTEFAFRRKLWRLVLIWLWACTPSVVHFHSNRCKTRKTKSDSQSSNIPRLKMSFKSSTIKSNECVFTLSSPTLSYTPSREKLRPAWRDRLQPIPCRGRCRARTWKWHDDY